MAFTKEAHAMLMARHNAELEAEAAMYRQGFTRCTVQVEGKAVTEWVKLGTPIGDTKDIQPAPSNGRIERPVTWQPQLETTQERTSSKPSHATWKKMDTRNWYRVGAPWYTCPNCTVYETVTMTAHTELVADEETGKVSRMTTYSEQRVESVYGLRKTQGHNGVTQYKETEMTGNSKPVNGMNLYRSHTDGHDECADCGWIGPLPDPNKKRRKPKTFWLEDRDKNRGSRIEATGKQTVQVRRRATPTGQHIDKKAILAAYLAARQKEQGK